jgi:hypothetical protein
MMAKEIQWEDNHIINHKDHNHDQEQTKLEGLVIIVKNSRFSESNLELPAGLLTGNN